MIDRLAPTQAESAIGKRSLPIFIVLILAAATRIYLAYFAGSPVIGTDSYDYFEMADGILSGAPISFFPNGYPLIVAGAKLLAGPAHFVALLLFLNVALSTLIVWMVYLLSRKVMSARLALLAAIGAAFLPSQLNFVRQIVTEIPTTFFLLLGILLLVTSAQALAGLSGIVLFFCGMIRSTLAPLGLVNVAYLLLRRQWKKAAFLMGGLAVGFFISSALYNAQIIKAASNFGDNLLISIHSNSAVGINYSTTEYSAQEKAAPQATYLHFAQQQPGVFIQQRLGSLWELWGPWPNAGTGDVFSRTNYRMSLQSTTPTSLPSLTTTVTPRSTLSRLLIGVRFPLMLLAIVAVVLRRGDAVVVLCALPIVLVTAVHTATFSIQRFNYPLEPLLIILAVLGASELWSRLANR